MKAEYLLKAVKLTGQISNERKTATLAVVGLRTDGEKTATNGSLSIKVS